jgi:hypothetical protein
MVTAEAGAVQLHPHDTGLVVAVLQMHHLVFPVDKSAGIVFSLSFWF